MHGWWPIVVPLAASALVYRPITRTYFYADDFVALYAFANGTGQEWVTTSSGGHLLLVRNLVVALLWNLFGNDPAPYFRVALATHLGIVALLFAIIRRSTGSGLLAAIVATAWGTCAMAGGTLSWMSAHGHAFAALAAIAALTSMFARARRDGAVGGWLALGWGALLMIGALCFGTGIAVVLLYPVLLVVLFSWKRLGRSARAVGLAVPFLTVALYVSAPNTGVDAHGPRAGTSARQLIRSASAIPRQTPYFGHLAWRGASSLVLGPAFDEAGHPDAASTVAALLVVLGLVAGWRVGTDHTRRAMAASLLVMAGAYGAIAIGRGAYFDPFVDKATFSLASGASIPRYHYEGQLALAIAVGIALAALLDWARLPRAQWRAAGTFVLAALVLAAVLLPPTIPNRSEMRVAAKLFVDRIRRDVASAGEPIVYLPNTPWKDGGIVLNARPDRFPGIAAAFIVFFPTDTVDGRTVRFETADPRWLPALDGGGRIAETLIVRPR